mmetsp:Transcript_63125/g.155316  ORF Transcript_63125/g.155316 Transcript_63125/m.155316 type:complete len:345 (+) Transcript_63125:1555-2589(+)
MVGAPHKVPLGLVLEQLVPHSAIDQLVLVHMHVKRLRDASRESHQPIIFRAEFELGVAAHELRVRLLHDRHPHVVRLIALAKEGLLVAAAGDHVIDDDRDPAPIKEVLDGIKPPLYPREAHALLQQAGAGRHDRESAKQPAVLQPALDDIGRDHVVLEHVGVLAARLHPLKPHPPRRVGNKLPGTAPLGHVLLARAPLDRAFLGGEEVVAELLLGRLKAPQEVIDAKGLLLDLLDPSPLVALHALVLLRSCLLHVRPLVHLRKSRIAQAERRAGSCLGFPSLLLVEPADRGIGVVLSRGQQLQRLGRAAARQARHLHHLSHPGSGVVGVCATCSPGLLISFSAG